MNQMVIFFKFIYYHVLYSFIQFLHNIIYYNTIDFNLRLDNIIIGF